jgi:hypothetical protein
MTRDQIINQIRTNEELLEKFFSMDVCDDEVEAYGVILGQNLDDTTTLLKKLLGYEEDENVF